MSKKLNVPKKYLNRIAKHHGRFGDTELVHVNKEEEQLLKNYRGLPNEPLPINPVTKKKEAFPIIAAIAGAVVGGVINAHGAHQAAKKQINAANQAKSTQDAANARAFEIAKQRSPEEMAIVRKMQHRAKKGTMNVPQLQSQSSRSAWSQARQAQQEQEGAMAMRGMEGSIVADELRRKTDTDTMRMVSDQARKIAMANEQTKMQAQGQLDQYNMGRANYLRQAEIAKEQGTAQTAATYYQNIGNIEANKTAATYGAMANVATSGFNAWSQHQTNQYNSQQASYGNYGTIQDPAAFMAQYNTPEAMNNYVSSLDADQALQFYNWTQANQ